MPHVDLRWKSPRAILASLQLAELRCGRVRLSHGGGPTQTHALLGSKGLGVGSSRLPRVALPLLLLKWGSRYARILVGNAYKAPYRLGFLVIAVIACFVLLSNDRGSAAKASLASRYAAYPALDATGPTGVSILSAKQAASPNNDPQAQTPEISAVVGERTLEGVPNGPIV